MEKVVICANASFCKEAIEWKTKLDNLGYDVIGTPKPLKSDSIEEYSKIHADHYRKINECDVLFVLNLQKNETKNYIGPSVFAEIAFAIGLNLVLKKKIKVICLNPLPTNFMHSEELKLWQKLGWITFWDKKQQ